MEKGLIPLAAMGIIRGWLVLEMSAATETEKALVKGSAQNRLNYDNMRTALLTIHEDLRTFFCALRTSTATSGLQMIKETLIQIKQSRRTTQKLYS